MMINNKLNKVNNKLEMMYNLGYEMLDFTYESNIEDIDFIIFDPNTYTLNLSFDEVLYEISEMIHNEIEFDEEYCKAFMEYVESRISIYEKYKQMEN